MSNKTGLQMSNKITTAAAIAVTGISGNIVRVEAAVSNQLPGMVIVGLADTALHEAKQRVRLACANSELPLSKRFLTVNLSPAELPKYGSGFDLGIALSCLAASGTAPDPATANCVFIGELGLDGSVKHVSGLFAAVLAAKQQGYTKVMVAATAAAEAALVPGMTVVPVGNLRQAVQYLETGKILVPAEATVAAVQQPAAGLGQTPDLAEIVGQEKAVRALIIAAAGRHNLAMWGPPGSGKTMLARALSGILPPLDAAAALTCSSIAAVCGQRVTQLVRQAPFVAPHHSASTASLIGSSLGRGNIQPGDITRAHHGVLFLDEAPEFSARLLDALRQPLESGTITIQRAKIRAQLPADFQLVLAANPCPCGSAGDPLQNNHNPCICSPTQQQRYLAKISGPIADRIDIRVRLHPVQRLDPAGQGVVDSATARAQVTEARKRQQQRFVDQAWRYNSETPGAWLRSGPGRLPPQHTAVLDAALQQGKLTLRGYDRVLRVAWTIADLAGAARPEREHIATALSLRGKIA